MSTLAALNATLQVRAPAAWACLSDLGRDALYPRGIPSQAQESAGCALKASIGQITTSAGRPLTLPSIRRHFAGLPEEALLYAPQGGFPALRRAWQARIAAGSPGVALSNPVVTAGLTHGLSLVADLFADAGTDVLLPHPTWGNYRTTFGLRRRARLQSWRFFDGASRLDLGALAAALDRSGPRAVLVLNLPGNPTGYSPYPDEVEGLLEVVCAHPRPLVVVFDDAYQGLVHDPAAHAPSLFHAFAARNDPERRLLVKVDGATKELAFFGGRVGFVTFAADAEVAAALEDKCRAVVRGTLSSVAAAPQLAVLDALQEPGLEREIAEVRAVVRHRWEVLREALSAAKEVLVPWPFNAGCFALTGLPEGVDAEEVRRRLIVEQSVGVVSIPEVQALRLAYCSIDAEDIGELVRRVALVVADARDRAAR